MYYNSFIANYCEKSSVVAGYIFSDYLFLKGSTVEFVQKKYYNLSHL